MLIVLILIIANLLDHVEPTPAAKLRSALALVLESEFLVIRDHFLVGNQSSSVSNILLGQAIEIRLHESRAEAFVLEFGQDSERVDSDRAAFLLVS